MRQMAKARSAVKTLTIVKNRDIVVNKMLKPCEDGNHSNCTGWAVLKKEISPIDANYFLKCTCSCHRKKESTQVQIKKKPVKRKQVKAKVKKKAKKKQKPKARKAKKKSASKRKRTKRSRRR